MKKSLTIIAAILIILAVACPSFAAPKKGPPWKASEEPAAKVEKSNTMTKPQKAAPVQDKTPAANKKTEKGSWDWGNKK